MKFVILVEDSDSVIASVKIPECGESFSPSSFYEQLPDN